MYNKFDIESRRSCMLLILCGYFNLNIFWMLKRILNFVTVKDTQAEAELFHSGTFKEPYVIL